MKQLTWLHLSDWHQKGPDFDRGLVRDALIKDLREREHIDPSLQQVHFVVFSGDLAFSGRAAEYEAARRNLLEPLLEAVGLKPDRLFIVPGNHDLDRDHVYEMLPPELQKPLDTDALVQRWLDGQKRLRTLEPFSDYRAFVASYTGQPSPDYASILRLTVGSKQVAFIGLNSALMCARHKDPQGEVDDARHLIVGEPQIHEALARIADAEIKMVVMHHPFDWLAEFDRNHIEARLGRECHFILRGHVHNPQVHVMSGTAGDCVIIPAGASYDRRVAENPRYTNAYNWGYLDFEAGQGVIYLRRWSEQRNEWIEDTDSCDGGKFLISSLPKALGERKAAFNGPPAAPLRNPSSPHRDRERIVLEGYLSALVRNNSDLDAGGIKQTNVQVVLPLEEIYVSLQAERDRPDVDRRVMQEELDEIKANLEREEDPKEREKQYQIWAVQARTLQQALEISGPREELANIIQRDRQVVVLGDPGSGKTTLLRYLTLCLARAIQADPERLFQPQELWDEKNVWKLPKLGPVRLPILLRISHYAEARQKDPDLALADYLPRYFAGLSVPNADELGPLLQGLLDEGRCMVLLDGLDEIIDPTDRRNIAAAIGQFAGVYRETGLPDWLARSLPLYAARAEAGSEPQGELDVEGEDIVIQWDENIPEDVRHEWSKQIKQWGPSGRAVQLAWKLLGEARYAHVGNRFVVTSRIAGYHFAGVPGDFEHYTIRRMSLEDIRLFLERWCPAVERRIAKAPDPALVEQRARRELEGILKAVETTPGVRRMAENPLLLRILAIIHRNEAHLPQRRVELYETATVTLLRDWNLERGTKGAVIDDVKATSLLGPVAFYIHQNRASGFLSKAETERILAGILARERGEKDPDQPSLETREAVHGFLETVREHSGLFVERGEGLYGFMHLTFEEYFTARQLVSSAVRAPTLILERLHLPRWREPILLAVGSLSKQFYDDARDLLRAILDAGSAYEEVLHRDLLFAAACVGDSVNVAPVLRQEIAGRLLALYCGRRRAGRYRLLQQQVKDALLTLCNDQGDAAVEAALAETLTGCADRITVTCALDAVEWLKARTPAVARALVACADFGGVPRAQGLLRRMQARLAANGNGTRPAPAGWDAVRDDSAPARLLGAMLYYGSRDSLWHSLGIPPDALENAKRQLRPFSLYRALRIARSLLQRFDDIAMELRNVEFWTAVAAALEKAWGLAASRSEMEAAVERLMKAVASSLETRQETQETAGNLNRFLMEHRHYSGQDEVVAHGSFPLDQALAQFRLELREHEGAVKDLDLEQVFQSAGSLLVKAISGGHTLEPAFTAAAARFSSVRLLPDSGDLRDTVLALQAGIGPALLALLRSPANGQQYQEAALFLAFPPRRPARPPSDTGKEEARLCAEATLIVSADLDGTETVRRCWALQALTSPAVRECVQFTASRRALLLGLLNAPIDQAMPALDILFTVDFAPDLLASCWSVLRQPDHPLADTVRERLDAVKEVKGGRQILVLLDEGVRDNVLRPSALELLRKVKWQGSETFAQALTWLSSADIELRHLAALLLAGQEDFQSILRNAITEASQERLKAIGASWTALREDPRLVRALGGLWLHGWDNALTQLWLGQSAEPCVDEHPRKYWKDFRTYPESDECIRWLLERAEFGQSLIPTFQNAAARLVALEGDAASGSPQAEHISAVQQEIIRQLDAVRTQPAAPSVLRAEMAVLAAAIHKETIPSIPVESVQAGLEGSDNNEWFAALSRLAAQRNEQPLVVSDLAAALESADRERRLRALSLLSNRQALREAMAEVLTKRFLSQALDAEESLCELGVMLQLKASPAGLYPWLRSLCTGDITHPLSAWMRQTLAAHDLAPNSPAAALARLLTTPGRVEAAAAASIALLGIDILAKLVETLVEAVQSPDDRVRIKGEQHLYSVSCKLSSDGSTSAVETLLRFKQDAEACHDGHLGTVSYGALSSVKHTQSFWVIRWLDLMGEEGSANELARHGLEDVHEASEEVMLVLGATLCNRAAPHAARRAAASTLGEILRNNGAMGRDASALTALTTALDDSDTDLRRKAAFALQWTTGQSAWPVTQTLMSIAQTDPDAETRALALRSLGCVLHVVRGYRDVDTSKEALFRWFGTQTKEHNRLWGRETAEVVKEMPGFLGVKKATDAETVLAVLSHPETLGLPEDAAHRLRGLEKWDELVNAGRQEWDRRRYWLGALPLLPDAIGQIEVFLCAPSPFIRRAAACALARLYHGDDDRPARLRDLLPDDPALLRALLDAATDRDDWVDESESRGSRHPWAVKQIVAWVEAKPPEERHPLIDSMLDGLEQAMVEMDVKMQENNDTFREESSGWPARRILTTVLAELSERLTYRAFTVTRDQANVVALFARAASDPNSYSTRRFAIRALGNMQQLNGQVADVFFAACQDVGIVYRETRSAVSKFKAFGSGSLERLTAAIRNPSITVAYHAAVLLGVLGVTRSEDLGRKGRQRVADELVQLLDDPLAERIVYDFRKGGDGERVGPLYDQIYEALVRVVAGPDAPVGTTAAEHAEKEPTRP